MSKEHYQVLRGTGYVRDLPLPPSPYRYTVKCFVGKRNGGWQITGHRWGDVPYHVGWVSGWPEAVKIAQDHVRLGGLARHVSRVQ